VKSLLRPIEGRSSRLGVLHEQDFAGVVQHIEFSESVFVEVIAPEDLRRIRNLPCRKVIEEFNDLLRFKDCLYLRDKLRQFFSELRPFLALFHESEGE